ncbi:MAG: hypothetical protein KGN34_10535, partial [Sphingomonadales bacterium]|nr:hypothetical protein [Sphingomonadales bacterium]
REGTGRSHLGLTRVGERRPLVPPVGMCHVAWSGQPAIAAYIARAEPSLAPAMLQRLTDSFPLIRARGYAIAAKGPRATQPHDATWLPLDQVRDAAYWDSVAGMIGQLTAPEIQAFDPAEAAQAGVSYISAPVFSPEGRVAYQLVLSGLPSSLSATDIALHAERLCATAAAVTGETHGRQPT